jgi:hypothetical protein
VPPLPLVWLVVRLAVLAFVVAVFERWTAVVGVYIHTMALLPQQLEPML